MVRVHPDRILGGLAQIFSFRTIVHTPVVHGQATRTAYRPPNNGQIARHQRDSWPLADPNPLGSWSDWTFLRKQTAAQGHDHHCQKDLSHVRISVTHIDEQGLLTISVSS